VSHAKKDGFRFRFRFDVQAHTRAHTTPATAIVRLSSENG
jgi:hypothetical protein